MIKVIVNCGPAEPYIEKCIASLRTQTHGEWEAYVAIDPAGDGTHRLALKAKGRDGRIHIRANQSQQYSMVNLIDGIRLSGTSPNDIIVVLDGDDWFIDRDALAMVLRAYQSTDCWMSYGSWVSDHPGMPGLWPEYPDGLSDFRNHEWLGTAVRTWRRWLWERIEDSDFRDARGGYFQVTEDRAAMLPMLEMSGTERARHIPQPLMFYNRSSPFACAYTRRDEMLANADYLRNRPPYARLTERPLHRELGTRRRRGTALKTGSLAG